MLRDYARRVEAAGRDAPLTASYVMPTALAGAVSAFDQANVAGAWTLGGLLRGEFNPLAFTEELEHRPSDGTPVKEVLNTPFIADEPEPLVDEEPRYCARWHTGFPPDETARVSGR
jgi:hypothetical protein